MDFLRHSCASLLLANNVPMKQIQDWLGHSDFSTTANIYAHLDYNSKLSSAQAMVEGLNFVIETPKEVDQNNDSTHQNTDEKQVTSAHL